MTTFLSGADCGPSNALKTVSGRVETDRSLQQSRLISKPNVAGPSRQTPIHHPQLATPRASGVSRAFDVGDLKKHLPRQHINPAPATSHWSEGFIANHVEPASTLSVPGRPPPWVQDFAQQRPSSSHQLAPQPRAESSQGIYRHNPTTHHRPPICAPYSSQPTFIPHNTSQVPFINGSASLPLSHEQSTREPEQREVHQPLTDDQEILARTAQDFVSDIGQSNLLTENPKLAQSDFYQLIKALGEKQVVAKEGKPAEAGQEVGEGMRFVERGSMQGWAADFMAEAASLPASGQTTATRHPPGMRSPVHRAFGHYIASQSLPHSPEMWDQLELPDVAQQEWDRQFDDQEAILQADSQRPGAQRRKSVHFDQSANQALGQGVPNNLEEALAHRAAIPGTTSGWEESLGDDLDFDEDAFFQFNGEMRTARSSRIGAGDMESWGEMQKEWEELQKDLPTQTSLGLSQTGEAERYLFQSGNPYSAGVVDVERTGRQSPTIKTEGVLELEAEVQANPTSHEAWYRLGLKQQENEREDHAIMALNKVIELEPQYRAAYIALAVSYTNEGKKDRANELLAKWINLGSHTIADVGRDTLTLIGHLIDMARQSPEDIDADIQIALGVLFNTSEEFSKAEDCFAAALSVRPDDWLLYNRVGATLANSGRSQEALGYYERALSLHPNFVRALFNRGISYSNLSRYALAAQDVLDALRLQHADATEGYAAANADRCFSVKGVTSDILWTTLRNACLHMGRQDLVALAAAKDLAAFPLSLQEPVITSVPHEEV